MFKKTKRSYLRQCVFDLNAYHVSDCAHEEGIVLRGVALPSFYNSLDSKILIVFILKFSWLDKLCAGLGLLATWYEISYAILKLFIFLQ